MRFFILLLLVSLFTSCEENNEHIWALELAGFTCKNIKVDNQIISMEVLLALNPGCKTFSGKFNTTTLDCSEVKAAIFSTPISFSRKKENCEKMAAAIKEISEKRRNKLLKD